MSDHTAERFNQTLAKTLQGMKEYMYEFDEDEDCVRYDSRNEDALYEEDDIATCQKILVLYRQQVYLAGQDYPAIMKAIQTAVEALNALNEACEHSLIETDQREYICQYMEEVIEAAGIDIGALAAAQGVEPNELTDRWREW